MRPTPLLRAAAAQTQAATAHSYTPLIKFKGRHGHEPSEDTTSHPQPHPASPHASLPDSFAKYREKVIQHGPLAGMGQSQQGRNTSSVSTTTTTGKPAAKQETRTGSQTSQAGQATLAFDRSELPARFGRLAWAEGEGEAVESGGASLW